MRWTLTGLSVLTLLAACRSDQGFTPRFGVTQLDADHGQWLSMTRAPDGSLAISFYDRSQGALGFAIGDVRGDEIQWSYERVDGYPDNEGLDGGDVGTHTSLVFAPDGTAWVAYHSKTQSSLKVAHRVGRTWTSETVDAGTGLRPNTGRWTDIAIDGSGQPVVVYHDEIAGTLRLATRSNDAWSSQTIAEGEPWTGTDADGNAVTREADVGEHARIDIDGNIQRILFSDKARGDLVMLEGFSGAYVPTVVDAGRGGQWPSMVRDGDTLAIAYHDSVNQDLRLAVREGIGGFATQALDDGPYRGADTALYRKGETWGVVYFDGRSNDMRLAMQDGEGWALSALGGDEAAVGFHNEVAQDGTGRWWSASYDYTHRNLHVVPLD